MVFKGRVSERGILEALEPARINDKTHFKIFDHGNLEHFPVGSTVSFTLVKDPHSHQKMASIQSKIEEEAKVVVLDDFRQTKDEVLPVEIAGMMHFYLVFNPMFNNKILEEAEGATQAHSFYNLLAKRCKTNPDSYLYWGKLKSTDTNEKLETSFFQRIIEKNTSEGVVTNLYISDFHFFWVARVESVHFELDKLKEEAHTLNFYKKNWDRIEAWFKITDMKLLSNHQHETNQLIANLVIKPGNKFNSRKDDKVMLNVTPYLSGLRYPLIIEDLRAETYFKLKDKKKSVLEKNILLATSESETQRAKSIIHSYVIPEAVFSRLSHQVQNEILSAEIEYYKCEGITKEDLYKTDFSVARKYLIALERCLNDVIRATNPPANSELFSPGDNITLGDFQRCISSQQHAYLAEKNPLLYRFLNEQKSNLIKWAKIRNEEVVHLGELGVTSETLKNIRRVILGVGIKGVIMSLYQATFKDLRGIHEIEIPEADQKLKIA
jgi:hypothetical protein